VGDDAVTDALDEGRRLGANEGSKLGDMLGYDDDGACQVCDVFVYKAKEGFWLGGMFVEWRKEGLEDVLGVELMVGLNEGDLLMLGVELIVGLSEGDSLMLGPELIDGAIDSVIDG
jgi:hypothetical protein